MYKLSNKPLITKEQIHERIKKIAQDIKKENFDILISVLNGSFIFTADICREIATENLEIAFIYAQSYGNSTQSSQDVKITGLENLKLENKKVLIIDDILDSGNTLHSIKKALIKSKAKEIKTCVLLNKPKRRITNIDADYDCFTIQNQFVVGYGLDFANLYRTLPEIWTVSE